MSREWNVASLENYLAGIFSDNRDFEKEELDQITRYNEYIITTIRTHWGASLNYIEKEFGIAFLDYALHMASPHLQSGKLERNDDNIRLTRTGIFLSDDIMSDLLWVED